MTQTCQSQTTETTDTTVSYLVTSDETLMDHAPPLCAKRYELQSYSLGLGRYTRVMAHRNRGPRPCLVCGNDDPASEHVIARWLRKELQLNGLVSEFRMDSEYQEGIRPWRKWDTLAIVLPNICKTCNGGWMRDLEQAIEPILKPMLLATRSQLPVRLDPEQQAKLA